MYIGPWQEYNLGRTAVQHRRNDVDINLKQNLERALLASLDPISAAKAIEALNPILQESTTTGQAENLSRAYESKRNNSLQSSKAFTRAELSTKLPSIRTDHRTLDLSNKKNLRVDRNAPKSFRSSLSEPINSTKLLSGRKKTNSSTSPRTEISENKLSRSSQTSYNVPSMVSLLKLERAAREQRLKPDFSQFWEWGGGPGTGTGDGDVQSSKQKIKQSKLATVNQMKQLYVPGSNDSTTDPGASSSMLQTSSSKSAVLLEPITTAHGGSSTPVVRERKLTEKDIGIVAKYFNQFENNGEEEARGGMEGMEGRRDSPMKSLGSTSKPSLSNQLILPPLSPASGVQRAQSAQSDVARTPMTPYYNDDTLLKWSLELDVGNIDDMY